MIATEVGSLWRSPVDDENTFSGYITLPWPLPANVGLKAILVPVPFKRSPKEKFVLHIEIPPDDSPPASPGPDDINCDKGGGRTMSQFFGPGRPPGKRYRILMCGESGTGKTLSALGFPRCAYIDNHGSTGNYQTGYPDHLYFPQLGQIASVELTTEAIRGLLVDPADRLTLVIDDITTYNNQVDFKWNNLFLKRQPGSKGHHLEFYSNQPSDYIHPKREKNAFIRRCLALDVNVILIARMKKLYAGAVGGADFMKVIGKTFDGDPGLIYEFDYAFQMIKEDDGKRYAELMGKQRVPTGGKPFPDRIEFKINKKGYSTFFDVFKEYAVMPSFEAPAHAIADPVKEEDEVTGKAVSAPVKAAEPQPGLQTDPAPDHPAPPEAGGVGTATSPAGAGEIQRVTKDQLDFLVALKAKFNIQKEEWNKELAKYDVTSARNLNQERADEFITYLEKIRVPF